MKSSPADRARRVQAVVAAVRSSQRAGQAIDHAALARRHADLMPELARHLRGLAAPSTQPADAAGAVSDDTLPIQEDIRYLEEALPAYRFIERIDYGGQGSVYLAEQRSSGRRIAVKLLLDGPLATEVRRLRFEREIALIARLHHPHIVRLLEHGRVRGRPFFAMEFVDGLPIDDHVYAHDLTLTDLLGLFAKVCRAVAHAHHHGVLHRDLKPANILVDAEGEPHLLDFGLAKDLRGAAGDPETLTLAGQVFGTLPYLSPEAVVLEGREDVDARADIYALGVLLFELLTGVVPYPVEGHRLQVRDRILFQEPLSLARAVGVSAGSRVATRDITPSLEAVVRKALIKDRDRRYATATAFAEDIERLVRKEAVEAEVDGSIEQLQRMVRRYRRLLVVSVAAAVLCMAVGMLWWNAARERTHAELALEATLATFDSVVGQVEANARIRGGRLDRDMIDALVAPLTHLERQFESPAFERRVPLVLRERLGDLAAQSGRRDEAEERYTAILSELEARDATDLLHTLTRARVHRKLGELQSDGAAHFSAALAACALLPDDGPDGPVTVEHAAILTAQATDLYNRGLIAESARCADHILDLVPPDAGYPDDARALRATGLALRGRAALRLGERNMVVAMLQEHVELREALLAERPDDLDRAHQLLMACRNRADAERDLGRADASVAWLRRAAELGERIIGARPDANTWRQTVYGVYDRLARAALDNDDLATAADGNRRAQALADELMASDPTDLDWARIGGFAHLLAGRIAYRARRYDDAAQAFGRSIEVRQRLAQSAHSGPDHVAELATAHEYAGHAADQLRDSVAALQHYELACRHRQTLQAAQPELVGRALEVVRSLHALARWHYFQHTVDHDHQAEQLIDAALASLGELERAGRLQADARRLTEWTERLNELRDDLHGD